ncbi:MAG: ATP-binding protein [Magnetospirillum sp.]
MDRRSSRLMAAFLMLAYVAMALGGASLVSLPPGNLTVFWLPAGIGVIIIRLLGLRLGAPAVFLSSLLANGLSMHADNNGAMVIATALSALVDCGQSSLGWWLWTRYETKSGHSLLARPDTLPHLLRVVVVPPLLTVWMLPLIHLAVGTAQFGMVELMHRSAMLLTADLCGLFLMLPVAIAIRDNGGTIPWPTVMAALALGVAQVVLSALNPLLTPLALFGLAILAFVFHVPGAALGNLISATTLVAQATLGTTSLLGPAVSETVFTLNLTILGVGLSVLSMGLLQAQQRRLLASLEGEVKKRTEELESRSQALAVSNVDLENFAYVASHDLREPLRMISSYLTLLERRLDDQLDEESRVFMGFARDGAKRMDRLILDLLDYSRLGRSGAAPENVDLSQVLTQVQADLGLRLANNQVRLHVDPLPCVQGNPSEITRLFQNLIGNAVKFTAADRPAEIAISVQPQGDFWRLIIADNGIGIPDDQRERVFGMFQRLHGHGQYEGTGIGLTACRRIVEHHGGSIEVLPQQGDQGCRIALTLPRNETA